MRGYEVETKPHTSGGSIDAPDRQETKNVSLRGQAPLREGVWAAQQQAQCCHRSGGPAGGCLWLSISCYAKHFACYPEIHTEGPFLITSGVTSNQLGLGMLWRGERESHPNSGEPATIHPVRKPDSRSHPSHLSQEPCQSLLSPVVSALQDPPRSPRPNIATSISNAYPITPRPSVPLWTLP